MHESTDIGNNQSVIGSQIFQPGLLVLLEGEGQMAAERRPAQEKRNMWFIRRVFCLLTDKTRVSGHLYGWSPIKNSHKEDYVGNMKKGEQTSFS